LLLSIQQDGDGNGHSQEVSRALGGNGHRKAEVASLIKEVKRQG